MSVKLKNKIKIIYIAGAGRSGSTLLEKLLNQVNEIISIGEINCLWYKTIKENLLCACSKKINQCPFWNDVFYEAFGGFKNIELDKIIKLQLSVSRMRFLPFLILPSIRTTEYSINLKEYLQLLEKLYESIYKISKKSFIVDSSKVPPHAFVLCNSPNIELYVIHLIRDLRAVVFSRLRKKLHQKVDNKKVYMIRKSVPSSILEWYSYNLTFFAFRNKFKKYKIVLYEELIKNPKRVLKSILNWLGINKYSLDFFKSENIVFFDKYHSVYGNPIRFKNGEVEIKLDDEWRKALPFYYKSFLKLISFPMDVLIKLDRTWRKF